MQASPSLGFNPDALPEVPPGTAPLLTLQGHGLQNYTCIANGVLVFYSMLSQPARRPRQPRCMLCTECCARTLGSRDCERCWI